MLICSGLETVAVCVQALTLSSWPTVQWARNSSRLMLMLYTLCTAAMIACKLQQVLQQLLQQVLQQVFQQVLQQVLQQLLHQLLQQQALTPLPNYLSDR